MKIINKKFNREYEALEKYEAGIALTGDEVKSIRNGGLRLENSFVKVVGDDVFLMNAEIAHYKFAKMAGYDLKRSRKLLLHKDEIIRLRTKLQSARGLTVAPISCYNKSSLIKCEIALVRARKEIGTKKYEKQKDLEREKEKEAREYLKQ